MADKDLTYRLVIKDDGTPTLRRVAAEAESTGAAVTSAQAKEVANRLREESRLVEDQITNARKVEKVAKEAADTQSQNLKSAQSELRTANAQALSDEKVAVKLKETAEKAVGDEIKKTTMAQSQAASEVAKNSREIANVAATRVNLEKRLSASVQEELKSAKNVRSSHQEKYRDLKKEEAAARDASATIVAGDRAVEKAKKDASKASKDAAKYTKQHVEEVSKLQRTMERIQRTIAAFVGVWVFQKIASGFSQMIDMGIEYNATLEQSKLGMSAIFTAQGQFVDSSGKALTGTEALNAAMEMSSDITKKLQLDNLQTAATYQQLVKAYQQTVAPGLAVGFGPNQIRQYTLAMVQAASAMGLNLDMLAEETRSMLRGTITPRNTLIATALGLRNEDIRKYKNDAEGLYAFIMGRLSAFGVAGDLAQKTWMGVTSNVKDAISMVLGESFRPMFEYLKAEMINIQNNLVKQTEGGLKVDESVVASFREVNDLLVNILKLSKEIVLAFTPLQSALTPVADIINFAMEKMTKMINIYYEYKKITDDLLSRIGSKIKSGFVEKGVPKELGGSIDMPFGDVSYNLKYIANKTGPGREEAEIEEKIAKINLQIATQNKEYEKQIYLVDSLTQAEIVKASAEGKSSVELENALKRQGEQRKKHILIQQDMEKLGWVGEILSAEAAIAGMSGNLKTQLQLERESLDITILKNRVGLGARDDTQIEAENYARMKFNLEAMQKLNVDRLAKESAIISAQSSIADLTDNYEQQAYLIQEAYLIKAEELKVTGKLNTAEEKRVDLLNSIFTRYKAEDVIATGLLKHKQDALELESRLAVAVGDTAAGLELKIKKAELITKEYQRILDRAMEDKEGNAIKILQLEEILSILGKVNEAEAKRRALELGFTQKKETFTFQSNIAELTGDWNASKVIEGELLKLEKDRAIAIGGLSDEGKKYAEQAYQGKMAEIEAQRTLNTAKLEEIGMTKYASKLHQDLADQYTNLIPSAIDTTIGAFGNFIDNIGEGTKSLGDAFRAFFDDLRKSFLRLWIDIAMTALKMQIMKSMGFGAGLGMNLVAAAVGGAAGGAGSATASWGGSFTLAGASAGAGGVYTFPRAGGGPVSAGGAYWVGERGPEVFRPSASGSISPNTGSGGPSKVTVQIINESGGDKLEATKSDIQFKPDEYIISVVLDAAQRNKMGMRDAFGGGR